MPRRVSERPSSAVAVLPSRVTPPVERRGLVPRTALLRRLRAAAEVPLVAVVAPAGYGKTTSLAQWVAQDPRRCGWLSLDQSADDPAALLTYLAAALGAVIPVDPEAVKELEAPHPAARRRALAELAASVAAAPQPFVLALDDCHHLTAPESVHAIDTLAEHLAPGCQLALAGRGEPPLPMARLRAEGKVLDVGVDELRMDERDAGAVVSAAGVTLTRAQVAELTDHTEGWPAGIYLAALARRAGGPHHLEAAPFGGDDRLVADYVRAEFLTGLPEHQRRFLVRTSFLDELSGPLCDAVLEESGSATLLEELEAANLLLVPLDRQRRWYRYHHLFAELLRHELDRLDHDTIPVLARRASDFHAEHGDPERAVHYAQMAQDVPRTTRLVLRLTMPWYAAGRASTLRRWYDWLSAREPSDATLGMLGAWLGILTGHAVDAERWAEVAERGSTTGPLPDGSRSIDSWRCALRAVMSSETATMRENAQAALASLSPTSQWRPTTEWLLGWAFWLDGEEDRADQRLARVGETGPALGAPAATALALAARALIAISRGRWSEAEALAERSCAVTTNARVEGYPSSTLAFLASARTALHRGDAARARADLGRAEALSPSVTRATPHLAVAVQLELTRVHLALGAADKAERALGEAQSMLIHTPGLGRLHDEADQLTLALKNVTAGGAEVASLTPAELRLVPLLSTHMSFREIAGQLYVSPHTVKHQALSIYRKLGVTSRTAAIERARSVGLLAS